MDTSFPVKESSTLFSPHLFAPDLNPGHARTKQNSFVSRGIVLDIENSDMSPGDYLRSFPELEMVIYSSFSHTPEAPRYRICLPTTHYMPPYVNEAICHMIARKLSDRRHGIDSQTFDCASLFYLPSKTDHSFIEHHHEGRQPLNPFDWIEQCPLEVWQAIDAVEEISQRADYQPTINASGFLAYMEQRWRSAPLGHGRTEFWFLAQGLKKLGWDANKIRAKLEDEVIYANRPAERESEIDALMLSL